MGPVRLPRAAAYPQPTAHQSRMTHPRCKYRHRSLPRARPHRGGTFRSGRPATVQAQEGRESSNSFSRRTNSSNQKSHAMTGMFCGKISLTETRPNPRQILILVEKLTLRIPLNSTLRLGPLLSTYAWLFKLTVIVTLVTLIRDICYITVGTERLPFGWVYSMIRTPSRSWGAKCQIPVS